MDNELHALESGTGWKSLYLAWDRAMDYGQSMLYTHVKDGIIVIDSIPDIYIEPDIRGQSAEVLILDDLVMGTEMHQKLEKSLCELMYQRNTGTGIYNPNKGRKGQKRKPWHKR